MLLSSEVASMRTIATAGHLFGVCAAAAIFAALFSAFWGGMMYAGWLQQRWSGPGWVWAWGIGGLIVPQIAFLVFGQTSTGETRAERLGCFAGHAAVMIGWWILRG